MHTAQLMPLPLTVSCFSKIQIGFTFLVPAHPGSPGQRAGKRVCVSVLKVQMSPLLIKGNLTRLDLLTGNRVSVERWHHQTLVHSMELAFTDNKPITEQSRDDPSNQHETDACTRHTQMCFVKLVSIKMRNFCKPSTIILDSRLTYFPSPCLPTFRYSKNNQASGVMMKLILPGVNTEQEFVLLLT